MGRWLLPTEVPERATALVPFDEVSKGPLALANETPELPTGQDGNAASMGAVGSPAEVVQSLQCRALSPSRVRPVDKQVRPNVGGLLQTLP